MTILSSRFSVDDTIVALASARGVGARGIVRISGPAARNCAAAVFRRIDGPIIPSPSRESGRHGRLASVVAVKEQAFPDTPGPVAVSGWLPLPGLNALLPCDAYLWPAGRGYTRQEAVELHTLGSPPLLELLVGQICQAGARPAEPGEFTLRAFLAGRLDLTQAEAVLGVIDAADRRQLNAALVQLAGGLGRPLSRLREMLLDLLAHLEAGLDFVDEDIEFISPADLRKQLSAAVDQVQQACFQLAARSESRPATRAVLIGRTNVGKSSLFNALAGRDQALVSPVAGTTRDYLAVDLDLDGIPCRLIDTAGAQADGPRDPIEMAADELRDAQSLAADIRLYCLDATRAPDDWERAELAAVGDSRRIVIWTKRDQAGPQPADTPSAMEADAIKNGAIETSAKTGAGLPALRDRLRKACAEVDHSLEGGVAGTAERCGECLRQAGDGLNRAIELSASPGVEELVAVELRAALDGLGQVVGQVYTDDILDRVFSRFCIGK